MNTPQSPRSGLPPGVRDGLAGLAIVRLGMLTAVGIFMVVFGLVTMGNPPSAEDNTGLAVRYFGPHGNSIGLVLMGLLAAVLGGYLLARRIRLIRADKAARKAANP